MEELSGWPFAKLTFNESGAVDTKQKEALTAALSSSEDAPTDVLVLSHGWNNDIAFATELYRDLLGNMHSLKAGAHADAFQNRKVLVAGVFWPSIKWADDDLIPRISNRSMTASLDGASGATEEEVTELIDQLADLISGDPALVANAKTAVSDLQNGPGALNAFVDAIDAIVADVGLSASPESSATLFGGNGDIVARLSPSFKLSRAKDPESGGIAPIGAVVRPEAELAAAGFSEAFGGLLTGARRVLNYTTYFLMKERAGIVGASLGSVLDEVRQRNASLRIHLVGHSFGARLVSASIRAQSFAPSSLSLLQGAFSHSGFSANVSGGGAGYFRNVIAERRVNGPIVVTHTKNDRAVGIAYAIASKVSGVNAAKFGDASDQYGGIGRNGAVNVEDGEAHYLEMQGENHDYDGFHTHQITNLRADDYVSGHGDVSNRAIANVILSAIR